MFRIQLMGILACVPAVAAATPPAAALATPSPSAQTPDGQVIFDQGPSTGTLSGCWVNKSDYENFSDKAPLPPGTVIGGIVVFTCSPEVSGPVEFKAVDEDSHRFLYTESGLVTSWTGDGYGGYAVTYTLARPYVVPSGTTMGYGLSGVGIDIGQESLSAPGDNLMSQYDGHRFLDEGGEGDQAFQLLAGVVQPNRYTLVDLRRPWASTTAATSSASRTTARSPGACDSPIRAS